MDGAAPTSFLREATREVRALAEEVRPSFGPLGLDRLVVSGDGRAVVSNAGAEILGGFRRSDLGPGASVVRDAALGHVRRWGTGCSALVLACAGALDALARTSSTATHARRVGRALASVHAGGVLAHCLDSALGSVAAPQDDVTDTLGRLVDTALWGSLAPEARHVVRGAVVTLATRGGAVRDADGVALHLGRILRHGITPLCVVDGAPLSSSVVLTGVLLDAGLARSSMRASTPPGSRFIVLLDTSLDPDVPSGGAQVAVDTPEAWAAQAEWRATCVAERVQAMATRGVALVLTSHRVAEDTLRVCERQGIVVVHGIEGDDLQRILGAMRDQLSPATQDLGALPVVVGECTVARIEACPLGGVTCAHRQLLFGARSTSHLTFASELEDSGQPPVAFTLLLRAPSQELGTYCARLVRRCLAMLGAWCAQGAVSWGGGAAEAAVAEALGPESVARALQLPRFAVEAQDAGALAAAGGCLAAGADAVVAALLRSASLGPSSRAALREDARSGGLGGRLVLVVGDQPGTIGLKWTQDVPLEGLPLEPLETKLALFLAVADLVRQLTRVDGVLRVKGPMPPPRGPSRPPARDARDGDSDEDAA